MNARMLGAIALLLVALPTASASAGIATDAMVQCAALGPKHPGSPADGQMGDRLIEAFRAAGLETSAERFHMPVWEPGATTMSIAAGPGTGTAYPTEPFAYSGVGHVAAEVVDLTGGAESDYDGVDVKGKIVMVNRSDTYHRTVQIESAIRHGAAAMLLVAGSPKNLIQTGSVRWGQRPPSPIPAVTIGQNDGAALRAQMDSGAVTLALDVAGERVDKVARNIVGFRKGTQYPDKYVVVAGHYDSWYAGAFDNCTAVGSLLHIAGALKDKAPAYSTYYIGWDAEEPGLVGSYDWISRHQGLIGDIVLNVNLEETASALFYNGAKLDTPSVQLAGTTSSPTLLATAEATAGSNLFTPVIGPMAALRGLSGGIIPTDIEGFYAQGVQGLTTAGLSPYYHTTDDTQDKINTTDLERISDFLADLVSNIQLLPPETLALREVPTVKVTAPASTAAGAAVPVDVQVTNVDGSPVTGADVVVLADQRHNWAVAEGRAKDLGGGQYRYTIPAGATDAFTTRLRATVNDPTYLANGFARVDQRKGGLLKAGTVCRKARVVRLPVASEGLTGLTARGRKGRVKVRRTAKGYVVLADLRKVTSGLFKLQLTATTAGGERKQKRIYRACA
ncbi:MAG: M28 family peptidase [Solirubrobacteraceae bacterium]